MNSNVLIIGLPDSAKTTFLAQFYTRIKKRKGRLKLNKSSEEINIKAIEDAVKSLANAEETKTTPSTENAELVLPVSADGFEFILTCPDYGGEQVRDIGELMEVNPNMRKRILSSDQWLFFIRPNEIFPEYDLSVSAYEHLPTDRDEKLAVPDLSQQSRLIEILQALVHTKGKGVKKPLGVPRLFIILTCWDELKTENTPEEVMRERLPLMHDLIVTNWQKGQFTFLGLSAQGFPLDTAEAKDKYLDELPENFGYVVHENGKQDKDLTKLIELAIAQ